MHQPINKSFNNQATNKLNNQPTNQPIKKIREINRHRLNETSSEPLSILQRQVWTDPSTQGGRQAANKMGILKLWPLEGKVKELKKKKKDECEDDILKNGVSGS